jgi:hypothetical protein
MTAYAHNQSASHPGYYDYDEPDGLPSCLTPELSLSPDDRLGQPLRRRRGRLYFAGLLLLLSAGGGTWAYLDHASLISTGTKAWTLASTAATSAMEQYAALKPAAKPPAAEPAAPAEPPPIPAAAELPAAVVPPPPAQAEPAAPAAPLETAAVPAAASESSVAAEPSPPITDPLKKRAASYGLHPELSRVLLEKLTETDYRNARTAIDTALAGTPDDGVLVWPRQAKPGLARFHVHFVQGAGSGCRRYVVTVAKEGWLTTALPLEKCGVVRQAAKRN